MNQSDYIPLLFGTPTFHWNDHRLMALRDDITCRDVIPSSIGSAAPGPEHMTPCKVSGGGGGHCRVRNRLEDVGDEVTSEAPGAVLLSPDWWRLVSWIFTLTLTQ